MHAPVETEIKLLATTAMLDRLGDDPRLAGPQQQACYENAYYDTLGGALGRAGAALRLRRGAGAAEQTLKLAERAGSPLSRAEWTVPAAGDRLDLTLFPEPARTRLEPLLGGSAVACFARTLVHRTTRRLSHGASLIEVAFDRGTICARDREEPLAELELELVDGSAADLLALALELPLGPNLRWSVTGKAARARTLAFDLPPAAVRAAAVELPANATLAEGLRTISWNGVNQLLANYPLALALSDPEAVHQTRVAIRRLRTALALFSGGPEARIFAAEFRALALALAPARDLHLLHERAGCEVSRAGTEDLADLLAALAAGRDRALDAARQVLAGEPFQRLLVRFALWLEAADGLAAA
ncbi:MAG TPA: CHAD domain-containing protein, partial [Novosphingobium sp.]